MQDDNNFENRFEMPLVAGLGETSAEQMEMARQYETNNPPFAGEQFGVANEGNEYYGEAGKAEAEAGEEYNKGISNAAALINYGLDAAAREKGVEYVVQTVKGFDASGSEDPIGDLYKALGVETKEDMKEIRDEGQAFKNNEAEFREGVNQPSQKRSVEGAFKAISDMKELIAEVEGAEPRYAELRAGAKAAGKGYFEYAVSSYGTRGLTELFRVLAMQREMGETKEEEPEKEEEAKVETLNEGILEGSPIETEEKKEEEASEEASEEEILKRDEYFGTETLNPEIIKKDEV